MRAANTGVSAVVLPSGAIQADLAARARAACSAPTCRSGAGRTFYTRFGDVFAYACAAVSGAALLGGLAAGRRG